VVEEDVPNRLRRVGREMRDGCVKVKVPERGRDEERYRVNGGKEGRGLAELESEGSKLMTGEMDGGLQGNLQTLRGRENGSAFVAADPPGRTKPTSTCLFRVTDRTVNPSLPALTAIPATFPQIHPSTASPNPTIL
jgi:hypothetical protein